MATMAEHTQMSRIEVKMNISVVRSQNVSVNGLPLLNIGCVEANPNVRSRTMATVAAVA